MAEEANARGGAEADPGAQSFFVRVKEKLLDEVAGKIVLGVVALVGILATTAYVTLKDRFDAYIDRHVAAAIQAKGELNSPFGTFFNDRLAQRVGFLVGEDFRLTADDFTRSIPFVVPPKHRVWLIFKIGVVANAKGTADAAGPTMQPKVYMTLGPGVPRIVAAGQAGKGADRSYALNAVHIVSITHQVDAARVQQNSLLQEDLSPEAAIPEAMTQQEPPVTDKLDQNLFSLEISLDQPTQAQAKQLGQSVRVSCIVAVDNPLDAQDFQ